MLLPKGIEKHKNLSTSFTRFDQLLKDLAENRFSGYIRVSFWGYEGVVVLDTGRLIEAYSSEDEVYLTGEQAVLRLLAKSVGKDGGIEVYSLSSEVALALGYAFQASRYDEDELGNYSLGQVFDFLERESVTGYVDLQFSNKRGQGTVYYLEGTPVEAALMSASGKIVSGPQVFNRFLEIGEVVQPHVVVSRVKDPQPISEERAFVIPWQHQKYLAFWKSLMQYLGKLMSEQFKKDRFFENFRKVCAEISDHYPFLHPEKGEVRASENAFSVGTLLAHAVFLQGMSFALNKMLQQIPQRRFRKLDIETVINEVYELARKNDVPPAQLDPQKLVFQIFKGFI